MERNNEQVKNIWKPLCILFAALLALTWVFFGFLYSNGKVSFSTLETPEQKQTAHGGAVIGESVGSGIELMSEKIEPKAYAENGVSAQADTAYTLTATITPDNATNKAVDWSVSFVNPASAWASGKNVTDYVTVTPTSDGALTANVECLQAFGEQIEVSVTSRENAKATASCTVDYARRITDTALWSQDRNTYVKNFGQTEIFVDLVVPSFQEFETAMRDGTLWAGDYGAMFIYGSVTEEDQADPEQSWADEDLSLTYKFSDYTIKDMLLTEPTGGSEYCVEQESEWDVASGFSGIFFEYYMELTGFPTSFTDMMNGRLVIGNNPFAILYERNPSYWKMCTEEVYNDYMGRFITWFQENPDTPIGTFTRTITGKYSAYTETYTFRYNPATVKMPVYGVVLDKENMVL